MKPQSNKILQLRRDLFRNLPRYAKHFLKIRTKSGAIKPFIFNPAQLYLHSRLEDQIKQIRKVRALILKGRQQGCSTYVGGRFYHKTSHHRGIRTFILTHEQEATQNLFDMVDRYHSLMHPEFKPKVGASNRKELAFDDLDSGYRVGTAGSRGVGRSSTIQLFHGSEVAFWPHADEHASGILQAVPNQPGTEVILESTANGMGNFYHKQWRQAVAGQSDYIGIFIPWYWQHEYCDYEVDHLDLEDEELEYMELYNLSMGQMAWRRAKIVELGDPLLFKQEYPATPEEAFQTTGVESFISNELVLRARKQLEYRSRGAVVAGYDPARDGEDRDAWIYRQNLNAFGLEYNRFNRFPEKVAYCLRKLKSEPYIDMLFLDYGGGGWEIAGMLREAGFGDRVRVVNFGSNADNTNAYVNKRAEMYAGLKEWLSNEDEPPSIPDDDELHGDIVAPSYSYDIRTRIKLERKEEIKTRLMMSPDGGDALALTFAFPVFRDHVHAQESRTEMCQATYKLFG